MAYMNSEKKAKIQAAMKPILAKFKVKGTLSVRNHSTIVLTLKQGSLDFIKNLNDVCGNDHYQTARGFRPVTTGNVTINPYWYQDHFNDEVKDFLDETFTALKSAGWYDRSDAMVDHFDTAYYVDVQVGKWNKPYVVTG